MMNLNFAHPEAFLLLPLIVVFLAVYLIAKRYSRATVTYAMIWERLAEAKVQRTWLKRLQRALTIFISTCMLLAAITAIAGPYVEADGEPPADIVLLIDTSPSMVRRSRDGQLTLTLAANEAYKSLAKLREGDRAWLLFMQDGDANLLGPWQRDDYAQAAAVLLGIEADFVPGESDSLPQALQSLPGGELSARVDELGLLRKTQPARFTSWIDSLLEQPASSVDRMAREKHLMIFTDFEASLAKLDWPEPWSEHITLDRLGAQGFDAAITGVQMLAGHARITWRGDSIKATYPRGSDASAQLKPGNAPGETLVDLRFPDGVNAIKLRVDGGKGAGRFDPISINNEVELKGYPLPPLRIALASTGQEQSEHVLIAGKLTRLKPESSSFEQPPIGRLIDAEVVFALNADQIKLSANTRALICFGSIPKIEAQWMPREMPAGWRDVKRLRSEHTFQSPLRAPPEWAGSDALKLEGTHFWRAHPLANPDGWTPLVASDDPYEAGLIATRKLGNVDLLYIAAGKSYDSAMLDPQGLPLLFYRWFERMAMPPASSLQPTTFDGLGTVLKVESDQLTHVGLESPVLNGNPAREWYVNPEAGSLGFSETWYPGEYNFSKRTREAEGELSGQSEVFVRHRISWITDPIEVPYAPIEAARAAWPLSADSASIEPWQENLPRKLLIISFALLVIEWLLYWFKILD